MIENLQKKKIIKETLKKCGRTKEEDYIIKRLKKLRLKVDENFTKELEEHIKKNKKFRGFIK